MRMRSWRRGTKEMDLILGPFVPMRIWPAWRPKCVDLYDSLLEENDQDLCPGSWASARRRIALQPCWPRSRPSPAPRLAPGN